MIDIGFTKLAVIGVVALVVIGPEKLPTVARMVGSLFGRAQHYMNDVKSEVSREMELEELRKTYQEVQEEVRDAANDIQNTISKNVADTKHALDSTLDGKLDAEDIVLTDNVKQLTIKTNNFRKNKLAKNSAIPAWYKHQHGRKVRVISGAGRVAKYSQNRKASSSFYS